MSGRSDYIRQGQSFQPSASQHNWLIETARYVDQNRERFSTEPTYDDSYQFHYAKLTSTLSAGSFSSPTTATVDVWVPDWSSGSTPKPLIITTDTNMQGLTVVNYWQSITGVSGTQCEIERKNGQWVIRGADCV